MEWIRKSRSFFGSDSGWSLTANWTAESSIQEGLFGYSVSKAGDVNCDGFFDVIVGATIFYNGISNYHYGKVSVYSGSATGLNPTANYAAESNQGSSKFNWSVSTAGDVNFDGYSKVIVSAPYYNIGQSNEARYLYFTILYQDYRFMKNGQRNAMWKKQ